MSSVEAVEHFKKLRRYGEKANIFVDYFNRLPAVLLERGLGATSDRGADVMLKTIGFRMKAVAALPYPPV
jgi:hypothetical protein